MYCTVQYMRYFMHELVALRALPLRALLFLRDCVQIFEGILQTFITQIFIFRGPPEQNILILGPAGRGVLIQHLCAASLEVGFSVCSPHALTAC